MRKKVEFDLMVGFFLLIFGSISTVYGITTVIINISLLRTSFFLPFKDIIFDIIFILLGLILIRKKRNTT